MSAEPNTADEKLISDPDILELTLIAFKGRLPSYEQLAEAYLQANLAARVNKETIESMRGKRS